MSHRILICCSLLAAVGYGQETTAPSVGRCRWSEQVEFRALVPLRPDARFGGPVPEVIRVAVLAGAAEANAASGTALHPQGIEYAIDNDGQCTLLRRATLAIVTRLAERGEEGYDGHNDRGQEKECRTKRSTQVAGRPRI